MEYLKGICNNENVKVNPEVLELLYDYTKGDLRRAINLLQSAAGAGAGVITREIIEELVGKVTPKVVKEIINYMKNGDFYNARKLLFDFKSGSGLDGQEIIKLIMNGLIENGLLSVEASQILAEYEYRLLNGAYEEIQLTAMLAALINQISGRG
jgi:replication factor C small subunit